MATAADWILAHPVIGAGRLYTAESALRLAASELARLRGVLEVSVPSTASLELGIKKVTSLLIRATRALDVVPTVPESPWRSR